MKKVIFIFALFLSTTASSQTKEETITWVREKLENYLTASDGMKGTVENIRLKRLNECEVTITYEFNWHDGERTYLMLIVHPGNLSFSSNGIRTKDGTNSIEFIRREHNELVGETEFESFVDDLVLDKREANITERVQKALAHLGAFCPKEEETF